MRLALLMNRESLCYSPSKDHTRSDTHCSFVAMNFMVRLGRLTSVARSAPQYCLCPWWLTVSSAAIFSKSAMPTAQPSKAANAAAKPATFLGNGHQLDNVSWKTIPHESFPRFRRCLIGFENVHALHMCEHPKTYQPTKKKIEHDNT